MPHSITRTINGFTVISDSMNISIEGYGVDGLIFKDKYYIQFDVSGTVGEVAFDFEYENKFYIIDKTGSIINAITSPKNIGNYDNLHVRHDSVIAKANYGDAAAYYLNEPKQKWAAIKSVDDAIFEDEDYHVTSLDFGEWGGSTWFRDKKTGLEYVAEIITPEIREINGAYYLISQRSIDVIAEPKKLLKAGRDYRNIIVGQEQGDMLHVFMARPHKNYEGIGIKNIYKSETNEWDDSILILASFAHNGVLYVFVQEDKRTYIAQPADGKLKEVVDMKDELHLVNRRNYRNISHRNNYLFSQGKPNCFGIMEIKNDTIYLHYINNTPPKK